MKTLSKIFGALVVMATFAYFAYTMYNFDNLNGRQYIFVILIASFMVSIFGKTIAAIITTVIGILAGIFIIRSKEDKDEDTVIPAKKL